MRLSILFILVCLTCHAKLVPFFNDPSYQREEPVRVPWYVQNNGQPSLLYHNGVYVSQETGTNDLNLPIMWQMRGETECPLIGMVDMATHGDRVQSILRTVAPGSTIYRHEVSRWYPEVVAPAIVDCVDQGCKIITLTTGYSTPSDLLLAALLYADSSNVIVVCSVPNVEGDLDGALVDYPSKWNLPNVLPVSATDRNGQHLVPSATGSLCVSAPGRNIVGAGTYSSGTSYACPIAAGVIALTMQSVPGLSAEEYIGCIRATAQGPAKRIDPVAAISLAVQFQ